MKVIAIREVKQTLSGCVAQAQTDHVLITQHGKPAALLIGVKGYDLEDVILMRDPNFWELIRARRQEQTSYSLDEVRDQLGLSTDQKQKVTSDARRLPHAERSASPREASGQSRGSQGTKSPVTRRRARAAAG